MKLAFPLAESPDAFTTEKGRKLFAGQSEFVKGVVAMSGLPPADRMEVCFAGRSNVGKSTLINALTGTKALARASNTPGRTQEINFFTQGPDHYLVDLPGYGYANAPLPVVERWQRLLKQYLGGRQTLRRAFVLIDARHGVKPVDEEIMSLLDSAAVTFQCVLTKADKIKDKDRSSVLEQVRKALAKHPAAFPEIVLTSSDKGEGTVGAKANGNADITYNFAPVDIDNMRRGLKRTCEVLVAGDNFGCGSSREHAPWAIKDFGIRCVISTSFADIFFNNCFKNGILPIIMPKEVVDVLMQDAEKGENARMSIDLEAQTVTTSDGEVFSFEVDSFKKHCLLEGLDDISQTLNKVVAIDQYEAKAAIARPWV